YRPLFVERFFPRISRRPPPSAEDASRLPSASPPARAPAPKRRLAVPIRIRSPRLAAGRRPAGRRTKSPSCKPCQGCSGVVIALRPFLLPCSRDRANRLLALGASKPFASDLRGNAEELAPVLHRQDAQRSIGEIGRAHV